MSWGSGGWHGTLVSGLRRTACPVSGKRASFPGAVSGSQPALRVDFGKDEPLISLVGLFFTIEKRTFFEGGYNVCYIAIILTYFYNFYMVIMKSINRRTNRYKRGLGDLVSCLVS